MTLNFIWWWGSSFRVLWSVEYSFITITSRSTLIQCDYGLVGRVFANCQEDLGSIPGRVIPKTLKMVLDTSLLDKVHIKSKVEQSRESSPTPRCISYLKGSLQVTLDNGRQLYLLIHFVVPSMGQRDFLSY